MTTSFVRNLPPDRHVVIAGPTASGKSALALRIAQTQGGTVVNADALQVWSCWQILTARPDATDLAQAPHALYGHVAPGCHYSAGEWLSEVSRISGRLIVVGGTGLYLNALTRGLAEIPPTPAEIRAAGDAMMRMPQGLARMVAQLDPATRARIDLNNSARVQRAWEVLQTTGKGIVTWQQHTPPPLIDSARACMVVLESDRDWLATRIERRFHRMMDQGALDEVRANLPRWDQGALWARAIGASELVEHLQGRISLETAIDRAIAATRQYAKAQRTFFRGRMRDWPRLRVDA
ncbi:MULTISPECIES: tRNA (adenosine(37)-N6)-dimethylallyltransferase MiaA [unclassified Paracoccus (in: a-proteobacteria)]|uniref:tRNA (adenosine(37)-N6)-dimethylallyltransferase MiaA n=1 Tax=unclassified Paracoccus (in: a-proteobacteria) TaxID=2688777 RepID=UPI001E469070|nr:MULTISPECIES: tRNA (adenosine(37)-N6)-dimethylallyltransferase MiaA [unclassified Paracoccus (in: a-proteobacteria)]UXU74643.1 tRNA (adenosine(37)-N6)-dimethylallyltransferase MiaA [Paracoccus sp. SMMA_5]UXU80538.1 tRNA (adenosine(37)-N6)-dimethylallyltransferase MiaA [Paracoccus sp. SMMA_5_TC]